MTNENTDTESRIGFTIHADDWLDMRETMSDEEIKRLLFAALDAALLADDPSESAKDVVLKSAIGRMLWRRNKLDVSRYIRKKTEAKERQKKFREARNALSHSVTKSNATESVTPRYGALLTQRNALDIDIDIDIDVDIDIDSHSKECECIRAREVILREISACAKKAKIPTEYVKQFANEMNAKGWAYTSRGRTIQVGNENVRQVLVSFWNVERDRWNESQGREPSAIDADELAAQIINRKETK